jgi:NodT family efflux transporter outer membrane factor (OMF) lipoprotein
MSPRSLFHKGLCVLLCGASSACLVGPNYHRPSAPISPAFKESAGWAPAQPSDAANREDWWTAFGDPTLDALEAKVAVSNQTLIAAEAAYREATALVRIDRAALFPTVSANGAVSYSGVGASSGNGVTVTGGSGVVTTTSGRGASYQVGLGGSWQPDLWGAVRRTIEGARASAQAAAGTVASARLSAQMELALDYVQLRQLDDEIRIYQATSDAYRRSLTITQNKYAVGVAAKSDVLTSRSQLATTDATAVDLIQQRATFEHAIAILTGEPPASLNLPSAPWNLTLPAIPASVPSTLLERRPDIATAERNAAAANAQIGVQVAAYYPTLSLTGSGDFAASELGQLFNASSFFWSVGASAAETLLDFGARRGRVAQARAAYDQSVATYRQTVLTALGQVEDDLAAQRVLGREETLRRSAAADANADEIIARNEYNAGQVDYTTVVVAEATALSARITELQVEATRLATAIDLIAALGGGWNQSELPAHP